MADLLDYRQAQAFAYDEGVAAGQAHVSGQPFTVRPQYDPTSDSWLRRRLGTAFFTGFSAAAGLDHQA
jgi:hypothetical protein